jgi:hypothetical protein
MPVVVRMRQCCGVNATMMKVKLEALSCNLTCLYYLRIRSNLLTLSAKYQAKGSTNQQ